MKYITDNQRERLLDRYDPDDIIDILGLDSEQLIELLESYIANHIHLFELDDDYDSDKTS